MIDAIAKTHSFEYQLERATVPCLCAAIAEGLLAHKCWGNPDRTGLYLLSPDAGTAAAVAFWKSALEIGPGLVSPGSFPWTLANGPASCLARLLDVKGPNVTLVGDEAIWPELYRIGAYDLEQKRIDHSVLIYLNVEMQTGRWELH